MNKYRNLADPFLMPMARRLCKVHPDTLTWIAFAFAVLAGVSFWAAGEYSYHMLLLATLAIVLNSLFDALDGWVARLTGTASTRGDFLDHVLDRYADAFIIGGIVLSIYCHITVGLVGLLGVFFTSYMGTQSQALGLKRDYGGILGRADRLVLLILVTLAQWVWVVVKGQAPLFTIGEGASTYHVTLLELLLVWFAIAGHATAVQRAVASWKALTVGEGGEEAVSESEGTPVTVEISIEGKEDEDDAEEGGADAEEADEKADK